MDALSRLCIIGNVDDGKSTLVGRLLMATESVRTNEIQAVRETGKFDLAHFTDGLKCEQEGAFTLDVAYRHLRVQGTRVLLADAPGHIDKFQSALTAISQSDGVIIVSDGARDLSPLVRLLAEAVVIFGVQECVVVVTKMDQVGYEPQIFRARETAIRDLFQSAYFSGALTVVPVSAMEDQNILVPSASMPWHFGRTLVSAIVEMGKGGRSSDRISGVVLRTDQERFALLRLDSGTLRVGDSLNFFSATGNVSEAVSEILLGANLFSSVQGPVTVWVALESPLSNMDQAGFSRENVRGSISPRQVVVRFICEGSSESLRELAERGNLQIQNSWIQKAVEESQLSFRSIDFLEGSGGGGKTTLSIAEGTVLLPNTGNGPLPQLSRKLSGATLVDRSARRVIGCGAFSGGR